MTMPIELTVTQAREKVLLRAGVAQSAAHNVQLLRITDEFIRTAHAMHYYACDWLAARREMEIAVIADQAAYDWPDTVLVGQLNKLWIEYEDGRPVELDSEPDVYERHYTGGTGMPRFYRFMDGQITLYPAPGDQFTKIKILYTAAPTLNDSSDRLVVDSELVVQQATVLLMLHLGLQGASQYQSMLERYRLQIIGQQANLGKVNMTQFRDAPLYYRKRYGSTRVDQQGYYRGGY